MPTKVHSIRDFSGGVNSQGDTTNIKDNESTNLVSLIPDRRGRLKLAGGLELTQITYDGNSDGSTEEPGLGSVYDSIHLTVSGAYQNSGYGLFYFKTEHPMLSADNTYIVNGDSAIDEVIAGCHFAVVQDNRYVKIFDLHTSSWLKTALDGRTNGGGNITDAPFVRPVYYYGDNGLRISAAHTGGIGGTLFHRRWLGYIERTLFDGDGSTRAKWVNHKRWHQDTAKILPPSSSSYSQTVDSETPGKMVIEAINGASADAMTTAGVEGVSLGVKYNDPDDTGTWEAKTYKFYGTYIYDGSQESNAYELTTAITSAADKVIYLGVLVSYSDNDDNANVITNGVIDAAGLEINPRITGGRFYFSDPDDGDGILYHMLDFDFKNGCRKVGESVWTVWDDVHEDANHETYECPDTVNSDMDANGFKFEDPPKFVTYETINGYGPDEDLNPEFNCAAMVGKRMYIGNVKVNDTVHNDRIMRSPVNFEGKPQYDTFPETHFLEVGADDGDSIIHLIADDDRLIVFKKSSVSVLNVGKFGGEYIENKFDYVGINYPCQAVRTDVGVVWVNSSGCHLFSQGKLTNLVSDKLLVQGKLETYQSKMSWNISDNGTENIPSIGYLPNERHIIVAINIAKEATSATNDCWLFDIKRAAWSYLSGSITTKQYRSNFVNGGLGGLYQLGAAVTDATYTTFKQLYNWNPNPTPKTDVAYTTKELDFGEPNINKKIYKVAVSFKTNTLANIKAFYTVDGEDYIGTTFTANKGLNDSNGKIAASAGAMSTELIKYDSNGNWLAGNGGTKYIGHMGYLSHGSNNAMIIDDTFSSTGSGDRQWNLSSEVTVDTGRLKYDDADAGTAGYQIASASLRVKTNCVLKFTVSGSSLNITIKDSSGGYTLVAAADYGVASHSVSFVNSTGVYNGIQLAFSTSSAGVGYVDSVEFYATSGLSFGIYNGSPSVVLMKFAGDDTNANTGLITLNQGSGVHYITAAAERYQIRFNTGAVHGLGLVFRLITVGTSSSDLPHLSTAIAGTYDSNSDDSYPQSIPLQGTGVVGAAADYVEITGSHQTYNLITESDLTVNHRLYLMWSVNDTNTTETTGGVIAGITMRDLGNWHSGYLNFSSIPNCKTFQVMLRNDSSDTVPASFELRNMEIYYRTLRPKITGD